MTDVALIVLCGLAAFAVFALIGVLVLIAGYLARIALALEADLEVLDDDDGDDRNVYSDPGPEGIRLRLARDLPNPDIIRTEPIED